MGAKFGFVDELPGRLSDNRSINTEIATVQAKEVLKLRK